MIFKIVSGGQTGSDRAALDFAIANGIPHGGWCPRGRLAVDGPLDPKYRLTETDSAGYSQRTKFNVRDSDGTLVLNAGALDGGTSLTVQLAQRLSKPCLVVQVDESEPGEIATKIRAWLAEHSIQVLNVAGTEGRKEAGDL